MLGMGPEAHGDEVDLDLINAGKIPVPELPGALYFHHADSCAMKRGGHVDICVLRRNQVCKRGDRANWHAGEEGNLPVVGGAMDLAIGAKQTFVMMSPLTREGKSRIALSARTRSRASGVSAGSTPTRRSSTGPASRCARHSVSPSPS